MLRIVTLFCLILWFGSSGCRSDFEVISTIAKHTLKDFRYYSLQNPKLYPIDSLLFLNKIDELQTLLTNKKDSFSNIQLLSLLSLEERADSSLFNAVKNYNPSNALDSFYWAGALLDFYTSESAKTPILTIYKKLSYHYANTDYAKAIVCNKIGKYYKDSEFDLDSCWHYLKKAETILLPYKGFSIEHFKCYNELSYVGVWNRKKTYALALTNNMRMYSNYLYDLDSLTKAKIFLTSAFVLAQNRMDSLGLPMLHKATNYSESKKMTSYVYQLALKNKAMMYLRNDKNSELKCVLDTLQLLDNQKATGFSNIVLAQKYAQDKNTDAAILFLEKSLYKNTRSSIAQKSQIYALLTEAFTSKKDFEKAILYNQKQTEESGNLKSLAKINKLDILWSKFNHTKNINILFETDTLIESIMKEIKVQLSSVDNNKLIDFFENHLFNLNNSAIKVYFELYTTTGRPKFANSLLYFANAKKHNLLTRDYLLQNNNTYLPSALVSEKNKLVQLRESIKSKSMVDNSALYEVELAFQDLENRISFYGKSFTRSLPLINQAPTIKYLQDNVIDNETTLIDYSVVGDKMFTILITNTVFKVLSTPFTDDQKKAVNQFYNYLANYKSTDPGFNRVSEQLGQLFFDSFSKKDLKKNIVYFTDENLYFVNPAAIIYNSDVPNPVTYYGDRHRFYQGTNFSLLLNDVDTSFENEVFFGFTNLETIACKSGLSELPVTYQEGQMLKKQNDLLEVFDGSNATKERFLEYYQTKKMDKIYISTHSASENGRPSVLYFKKDRCSIDSIHGYDLINKKRRVKYVVLNSCQSSVGNIQKGEGVTTSLSKYFIVNGAQRVDATLWPLNDNTMIQSQMHDPNKYLSPSDRFPHVHYIASIKAMYFE